MIDSGALDSGSVDAWATVLAMVQLGFDTPEKYANLQQLVDVTSFIDFMIVRMFAGDEELDGGNWYAVRNRNRGEPFRFLSGDSEQTLLHIEVDKTQVAGNDPILLLYNRLRENALFRREFGDRIHRHFFNDGALDAAQNAARWTARSESLEKAMVAESARWGDFRRDVHPWQTGPYELYTRDDHWLAASQQLLDEYFPQRSVVVLEQFHSAGLYPDYSWMVKQMSLRLRLRCC